MAAFINALYEEGTLSDCREWVKKMRSEQNTKFLDKGVLSMSKEECLTEISELWDLEVAKIKERIK